jgi:hypothetical protein
VNALDAVRQSCAEVMQSPAHVRINHEALHSYADGIAREPQITELDRAFHLIDPDEEIRTAFVIVLDSINFGSGWFPLLNKSGASSGYAKVAQSLTRWFEAEGAPSADRLQSMTDADCASIFDQRDNTAVAELMALFATALNGLGDVLQHVYAGSALALVDAAGGSAATLVRLLAGMPLFRDTADYKGTVVSFYKRAQITASDLALAFADSGPGHFEDADSLTCFADNVLPHVLRLDGILEYTPDLLARIERGELLSPGSAEEVELRAAAVTAVEELTAVLRESETPLAPRRIDNTLWERGRGSRYKAKPRHRARSAFY